MKLYRLIGDKSRFSIKHRILNIILIFGFTISFWSLIASYFLGMNTYSMIECACIGVALVGIYSLSLVRKNYNICILLSFVVAIVVIPAVWFSNGGIAGRVPFYLMLFSPMGTVLLEGYKEFMLTAILATMSIVLVIIEYTNPYLVTGYPTSDGKYIDVSIALITSIIANSFFIKMILRHYDEEHQLARKYLSQSEEARKRLEYLSFHDVLTGLYNRTFFELELLRLERDRENDAAVYVVDIDGLKFTNDTLGHSQGDAMIIRAAHNLRASFPDLAQIFRTGGDEYIVLLQKASTEELETNYQRIHDNVRRDNKNTKSVLIPLQLSVGYAYSNNICTSIQELLLEAENKMYREKLFHHAINHRSMIQTVKEMLSARDYNTGNHSDRLQNLLIVFAKASGVPESSMSDIQLFAKFHDIGKIGISDQILRKPGALTEEEKQEMQKHCEIGYRIACATSDLSPIADWVLRHHEWWNGEGYPLKLKGTDIAFECRLLAIADSYDAMTSDRPYRKAMSHEAAIEELKRYSGIQFDPDLVRSFILNCSRTDCTHNEAGGYQQSGSLG